VDFVKPESGVEVFFTPSEICNILVNQLGLPSQASSTVNIKLHSVQVWSMATASTSDRPSAELDVASVIPTLSDPTDPTTTTAVFYSIIKKLVDQGNLSDAAKVSYTWPKHMQDTPLSSQAVFTVCRSAGNTANVLTRFHLLWNSADIVAPLVASSSVIAASPSN
jgi:hypothetical protein